MNSSTCICENSKYLKTVADISVIECDEIISVMDIVMSVKWNVKLNVRTRSLSFKDYIDNYTRVINFIATSKK